MKLSPLLLLLLAACGAPNELAKTPEPQRPAPTAAAPEPPAEKEEAPPAPSAAPEEAAPATSLTKAQLQEASKIVGDGYPGPFEKTYPKVVAKLGEPKKKGDNMYEWYASDGGKCFLFFMTRDNQKGHAASGISETDASLCK